MFAEEPRPTLEMAHHFIKPLDVVEAHADMIDRSVSSQKRRELPLVSARLNHGHAPPDSPFQGLQRRCTVCPAE